ncbi:MAG TPA: FAD-dependent oxidoreductase [Clostridia bacterium]|nr:FAD-dependent oxidoreductase [Clostridia bacterium]
MSNTKMRETTADILIAGGGVGGVAAALAACRLGRNVILTEETDWIGGQLTAQAVPPDENPWIDSHNTGCTASYRYFREGVREYYRRHYPLKKKYADVEDLNPGAGNVSPLCHEPRVALAVLESMLAPYRSTGQLKILLESQVEEIDMNGDFAGAARVRMLRTGEEITVDATYILDATELGDILPLAGMEHVLGAESQQETGEPHALPGAPDPLDQQAISWVFTLDYRPGEDHTIERPEDYDFWQSYKADFWPDRQLSWVTPEPVTLEPVHRPIFNGPMDEPSGTDWWHFRRILFRKYHQDGFFPSDIISVNWPQIDYWQGPIAGVGVDEVEKNLRGSRQLSLSWLYWMQTEAPRLDGGNGYPELRLRGDVTGTNDLAKHVYVRESRRIKAEFTVLEQHVGVEARNGLKGAEVFEDSVGIGSYRIDLHPSTADRNYIDINNYPHQIPLGALIPVRVENVLPAAKNLGVTHITNGCYRLHPIEWNIGEAAGALAAYCIENKLSPRQVYKDRAKRSEFQQLLVNKLGFILSWPEELRLTPRDKKDPLGI